MSSSPSPLKMTRDFDGVLQEFGEFGTYQKFVVFLLCIPTCFVNAYCSFVLVFQAYTPKFSCNNTIHSENNTRQHFWNNSSNRDQCLGEEVDQYGNTTARTCKNFVYEKEYFDSTIITEWDLVCDSSIVWKNVLSYLNATAILGCFIFSYIQDRWGRKPCFFLSIIAYMVSGIASLFANSPLWFAILRTPWALSCIPTWNIGYIWALEYVGPSKRAFVTSMMNAMYGVATVSLALLAWAASTWVKLGFMTTAPFVLLFSYYFLIDESPRWLLTRGRVEEAQKTLKKMAKWQKLGQRLDDKPMAIETLLQNTESPLTKQENTIQSMSSLALLDLFRHPNVRYKTLLITCAWISIRIVYNAIAYNVENLGGNLYWTYVLQAAVEIPANVIMLLLLNRYGRVGPLFFSMLLCGVFCFISVPIKFAFGDWGLILSAISAKFMVCMSYGCIYLLAGELYPTVLRGLGTGFSSAVGDMGNIVMPYIIHSASVYPILPMIILGVLSILGAAGCLFLPETKDQYLPETVKEAEVHGLVKYETFQMNIRKFFWLAKLKSCK